MTSARGVTAGNWLDAPFNRWGFRHVGELVRTEQISHGEGAAAPPPRRERDLDGFEFVHRGETFSLRRMLEDTYTDGFLVIHDGAVVFEHYVPGMAPSDRHLLMSASKSFTSVLCGVLVGRGVLAPEDQVVEHVRELRGTSWEGCTIQHLLDMRTGTRWNYSVDEYKILDVSGYRVHSRHDVPADTASWIRSIDNSEEHGARFRYISLAADVLGWVLASAGGESFVRLFSRELWSAMGAEFDAEILVDSSGFPIVEGGICATLRDFARFGQMCLQQGCSGERQLVPAAWLDRLQAPDQELIETFADSPAGNPSKPHAFYHDNWWITDAERGVYSALGMNGQQLMIHRPSGTVAAKLSTQPEGEDGALFALQDVGMAALCESLAE